MSYRVIRTSRSKKRGPEQEALDPPDDQARLSSAINQFTAGTHVHELMVHHNLGNGARWVRPRYDE